MPQHSQASDPIAALNTEITEAHKALKITRARFQLNPSGEAVTAHEQAEAHLNDLLERRYALACPPVPAPRTTPTDTTDSTGTPGAAPLTGAS